MKKIGLIFLFFYTTANAQHVRLPDGVTIDTFPHYSEGLFRYQLKKNNQVIAMIEPATWHNNDTRQVTIATSFAASFYLGQLQKDTFNTVNKSLTWLAEVIEAYLTPVGIQKWQRLKTQPPKVALKYPWDWSYKLGRYNAIFMSKAQTDNKLVLKSTGNNEVVQIIRTPNTGNLTLEQVIKMSSKMNPAINSQPQNLKDTMVGGKLFKTTEHYFMEQMHQRHFWYADANEIIYIGINLFREEQIRYPLVVGEIINSIKW